MAEKIKSCERHIASPLYPYVELWNLFTYSGTVSDLREFVFFFCQMHADSTEEFAKRHLVFRSPAEFKAAINRIRPFRIEIGALHVRSPSVKPLPPILAHELIFDLDMNEYDEPSPLPARGCGCRGRNFCRACWQILAYGAAIIDTRLVALGSKTHMWFYSGGRSLHCFSFPSTQTLRDPSIDIRTKLFKFIVGPSNVPLARGGDFAIHTRPLMEAFLGWYYEKHRSCFDAAMSMYGLPVTTSVDQIRNQPVTEALYSAAYACLHPRADKAVTLSPGHVLRMPMGMHASTERIGVPVALAGSINDLLSFYPEDASTKSMPDALSKFQAFISSKISVVST
jgi:DNA primase catalytic subunit